MKHTVRYYGPYISRYRGKHGTPSVSDTLALKIAELYTNIRRIARAKLTYRAHYVANVCFLEPNTSIAGRSNGRSWPVRDEVQINQNFSG